jgi:hypothetical protein
MLVSEQVRHKILTNIQINSESNPEGDLQVYLANKYGTSLHRDALKSNMEQFFAVYSTPDAEKKNGCCEAHTPKISNRVKSILHWRVGSKSPTRIEVFQHVHAM